MQIPDAYYDEFKEARLSNEQAQMMLDFYAKTVAPQFVEVSKELELTKFQTAMGLENVAEAEAEATKILNWAIQQPDGQALIDAHGATASGVMYLKKYLEGKMQEERMPDINAAPAKTGTLGYTPEEIQGMIMDPRYMVDVAYTNEVQKKLQAQMAREEELASR
jgi:hypothetical protein